MPLSWNSTSTDPPYNQKGAFIYIFNHGNFGTDSTGYVEVKTYATCTEAGGDNYPTIQRLYKGEFCWLNLASPQASGTTAPRIANISNKSNFNINIDYALFSRV